MNVDLGKLAQDVADVIAPPYWAEERRHLAAVVLTHLEAEGWAQTWPDGTATDWTPVEAGDPR